MEDIFSKKIKLDYKTPDETTKKHLDFLDQFIVGQEYSKKMVSRSLAKLIVGMNFGDGPLCKFLLVGGTGTGKTLTVKTLARLLFGDQNSFLRISSPFGLEALSQWELDKFGYQMALGAKMGQKIQKIAEREAGLIQSLSITKNIFEETPDGEEKTELEKRMGSLKSELAAVRKEKEKISEKFPYRPGGFPSILLIENVDEANEAVQDLIAQTLNQGVFFRGNEDVSLKNCFVFMTAKILSEELIKIATGSGTIGLAKDREIGPKKYYSKMRDGLLPNSYSISPCLLKEIGKENIIAFDPLSKEQLRDVIKRQISDILLALDDSNIKVMVSENVYTLLLSEATDHFNKKFGAAPIEKIIEAKVLRPIRTLLQKDKKGGILEGDTVLIDADDSGIVFEKMTP